MDRTLPQSYISSFIAEQQAMIEELKQQLELKEKRNKILEQKAMIEQLKNQLESKEKQNQILETKIKEIGQKTDSNNELGFHPEEKNTKTNPRLQPKNQKQPTFPIKNETIFKPSVSKSLSRLDPPKTTSKGQNFTQKDPTKDKIGRHDVSGSLKSKLVQKPIEMPTVEETDENQDEEYFEDNEEESEENDDEPNKIFKNQLEEKQNQILETKIKKIADQKTDYHYNNELDYDHDNEIDMTKNHSEIDINIDLENVDFSPMINYQEIEKMEISPMKNDSKNNENIITSEKNSNHAKPMRVGVSRILSQHFGISTAKKTLNDENVENTIDISDKIEENPNFSEEKIKKNPVKAGEYSALVQITNNTSTSTKTYSKREKMLNLSLMGEGTNRASAIRNEEISKIQRKYFTFDPVKYPFRCRLLYCHFGAKRNEDLNEHIMEKHPTCSLARTLFNYDDFTVSLNFEKNSANF